VDNGEFLVDMEDVLKVYRVALFGVILCKEILEQFMTTITYTYDDLVFAQLYDFIIEKSGRGYEAKSREFFPHCAEIFGSPILEMGCGTGINLLPLAEMGYTITGLDNAPAMLKILEQKLHHVQPDIRQRVEFIEADMVNPNLERNDFKLIIFGAGQFLHLQNDQQRLACLKNTRRLLADDGIVLLCNGSGNLEGVETWEEWREQKADPSDEWTLFMRCGWQDGAFQEDMKVVSNSNPQTEHLFHWRLHPLPNERMMQLIEEAGLRPAAIPANLPENSHERFKRCAFSK
jgi:SAM-dependent methyltransferase